VELVVSDTGIGLPNGDAERVFEPLFTTKPEGLGLGLPVARSIVTASGGRLWAENNGDRGATFHLLLPVEGSSRLSARGAEAP
jgi:signal transduction histidine kinase